MDVVVGGVVFVGVVGVLGEVVEGGGFVEVGDFG